MQISILCSSRSHPVWPSLERWRIENSSFHRIELHELGKDLAGGDLLFLISCSEIISLDIRSMYKNTLVIHASNLPEGRGWSPHIWQVLEGRNELTVTLLEAEDVVDSGAIWAQEKIKLEGHELSGEINSKLFDAEIKLMNFAVQNFLSISPKQQDSARVTYYSKRTPADSEIDLASPLLDSFNLLRVVDNDRFPAFFYHLGHKYILRIEKEDGESK